MEQDPKDVRDMETDNNEVLIISNEIVARMQQNIRIVKSRPLAWQTGTSTRLK